MQFLRLILLVIGGCITLVKEIRKLAGLISSKPLPYYLTSMQAEQIEMQTREPMSMEQVQVDMEKLFHKNQLFNRIKSEFVASDIPFKEIMRKGSIDPAFGFSLLVQMVLHKRTTLPVLVGVLRKHYGNNAQTTADAIFLACKIDLIDWNPTARQFIIKYDISQDVQDELDKYQFPLPMIVLPKELKTNTDTGYFTSKNSVILKNNHHDDDVCLDHLNNMNRIKLKLNNDVTSFVKNSWKNLDKPKPNEDRIEYNKRVRAFEKYDRTVYDVIAHLSIVSDEFYLTHKYDKRGRVYCQGYHVTYQGNQWNKAVIEFAKEEHVL